MADKGFYILPSDIFQNVRRNDAGDPNLNETPEKVFAGIEGPAL